ncbi:MAG: hypothetical protein GX448_00085 [Planctomycetes bacterium]|jgi:hypothetical protein|nr:hypothetical protein [Planctomycetota bacterium]
MIENVQNNRVAQMMGIGVPPRSDAADQAPASDLDATLQVDFADMVNQALQATETDSNAVAKAKELLQSGQLTTPENIRSAAENMLRFGI